MTSESVSCPRSGSREPFASRVLITGAGGFIGSHLTELCVARGCQVRALVHYNADGRCGWLDHSPVRDQVEVVAADVRDFDCVYRATADCDAVFHLAALIGIPHSYRTPLGYVRTNIEGTYNILEAARLRNTRRVVVTSTSETYGTAQYVPIDENHPCVAQSPYAATKIAADQLALSYHRSFDLPVWLVRPFNTYGPRQSARAFIPTVISQLLRGQRSIQLGSLSPTRDLTYVTDTAAGFLAIAASDDLCGSATNIGTGAEISMGDLVQKIAGLLNRDVDVEVDPQRVRPATSEVERLVCNNERLRSKTDWRPEYDLESGLNETIRWISKNPNVYKAGIYSE